MRRRATLVLLLLLSGVGRPVGAQVSGGMRVTNVAANAAIGGLIAGVRSVLRGRPGMKPVLLGAAGGALQSAGRQVAAGGSDGAGLLGREISAAGISLTYSAGVDSLVGLFPVGRLLVEVRPREADRVRLRDNAVDVVTIAVALVDGRADFDVGASLSLGAPVFVKGISSPAPGVTRGGYTQVGTVFLARGTTAALRPSVLAHEAVHVLQWDAINLLVGSPAERALLGGVPGLRRLTPHLDLGVTGPAVALLIGSMIEYERRPWEREAYRLSTGEATYR